MVIELQKRSDRVRFKHPVRVIPLDGSPRIYRTLAINISRRGMFVRMPEPLPKGTRVALSLEANGHALPFAEAEIAWCRVSESHMPGRFTGFGVRFTSFLNPRAPELVEYLVKNLDRGRPLKVAPPPSKRKWVVGAVVGVAALAVVAVSLSLLGRGSGRGEVEEVPEVVAAEEVAVPAEVPSEATAEPELAALPDIVDSPSPPPLSPQAGRGETEARAPQVEPARRGEARELRLPSGAAQALTWTPDGSDLRLELGLAPGASLSRAYLLSGPPRLVLELDGRSPNKSYTVASAAPWLQQVRVGPHGKSTHLVLDLTDPATSVRQVEQGVLLRLAR